MDFPFREYSDEELLQEFDRMRLYKFDSPGSLKRARLGYKCSNAFFQKERMDSSSLSKVSGLQYWEENKEYIRAYSKKAGKTDLFSAVQFLNHIPAQFPPIVAACFYIKYGAAKVLDPFAGWGDRCLAAMALGVDYIGVDSNKSLRPCFDAMTKFYPHASSVDMIYKPFETVALEKLDFDFVFSSPPFWEPNGQLSETYKFMKCKKRADFIGLFAQFIRYCTEVRKVPCCFYMSEYMAKSIPVKYDSEFAYRGAGNKRVQRYSIYCYSAR